MGMMDVYRRFFGAFLIVVVYIARSTEGVQCPYPGEPKNGRTVGSSYEVTAVVEFFCNEGFNLNGFSWSTCLADRTWSQSVPICKAVTCPSLSSPMHGQVSWGSNGAYEQTVTITCDKRYAYSLASNMRQCQQNETWSGQDGQCVEIDCGNPTLPNGEVIIPMGTKYEALISFLCNEGTRMNGSDTAICTSQQKWDQIPTCISVSEPAPSPSVSSTPEPSKVDLVLVVGLTIAIVAAIAVILCIIVYVYCIKNKRPHRGKQVEVDHEATKIMV